MESPMTDAFSFVPRGVSQILERRLRRAVKWAWAYRKKCNKAAKLEEALVQRCSSLSASRDAARIVTVNKENEEENIGEFYSRMVADYAVSRASLERAAFSLSYMRLRGVPLTVNQIKHTIHTILQYRPRGRWWVAHSLKKRVLHIARCVTIYPYLRRAINELAPELYTTKKTYRRRTPASVRQNKKTTYVVSSNSIKSVRQAIHKAKPSAMLVIDQ